MSWCARAVGAVAMVACGSTAWAASLQAVSNWKGTAAVPADVNMFVYVPDKAAAKPPLLVLVHYCGGSAQAVFDQAKGGGLIKAADQYGFVVVVPSNANSSGQNGRCWDVTSAKAQKRDGGGDTHAIAQMVRYALTQYRANAERVYATGDSSGGMTTQLLLALYPDIFKAGSSFAGVPAGCANVFDGTGLCGLPAQTAQQWGDRVRGFYPGYTGHRPRVQLFHGDADTTIVYKNFDNSVSQWTNVLGLGSSPTATDTSLTLGANPGHKATRKSWKSTCGYLVFDAFTELGGDHGPSDTLFVAQYVVPFLGLDKTQDVDPEVEQCGGSNAGAGGAGGAAGSNGSGGVTGAGGSQPRGGTSGLAGRGDAGTGGSEATGGRTSTGGLMATGGRMTGGQTAGMTGGGSGGVTGSGGTSDAGPITDQDDTAGCNCAHGNQSGRESFIGGALALGLALTSCARRRRG